MSQEFKEIKTYFSILNAIAYGNTKPTEIANFVGLNAREIYPYLELLISYGFIKRKTSILSDKKRGIYIISDVFFDFWLNFVYKHRESIEKDSYKTNLAELNSFFGKRFEIFISDNFNLFSAKFKMFGRWWHKDKEIDIVALNEKTKEILFAECKWKDRIDARKVLAELKEKARFVEWHNGERKEHYAIFTKSFKKKAKERNVYCFDLGDVKKVLL